MSEIGIKTFNIKKIIKIRFKRLIIIQLKIQEVSTIKKNRFLITI